MSRTRLFLAAVMVTWATYDAMYAKDRKALQVAEDVAWLALILYWPQVRSLLHRITDR